MESYSSVPSHSLERPFLASSWQPQKQFKFVPVSLGPARTTFSRGREGLYWLNKKEEEKRGQLQKRKSFEASGAFEPSSDENTLWPCRAHPFSVQKSRPEIEPDYVSKWGVVRKWYDQKGSVGYNFICFASKCNAKKPGNRSLMYNFVRFLYKSASNVSIQWIRQLWYRTYKVIGAINWESQNWTTNTPKYIQIFFRK